jgi:uracil-DNA glycosylase
MEALRTKYKNCKLCLNSLTDKKVFGDGNLEAKVAIIGEGPGEEEVKQGIPFVGPAGKLLDKILSSIGLHREELYFTNVVICRTDEKNRTPNVGECKNCIQRLYEELSIVKPIVTLLVGSTALKTILGSDYQIMKDKAQWVTTLKPPCYFYYPILHPAWILHSSTEDEVKAKKKEMWKDIRQFAKDLPLYLKLKLGKKE